MPVPRTECVKSLSDLSILHTHLPTTGILPIPHTLACSHNLYSIHSTHSHAYNLYPFHTLLPSHNLYSIHSTLAYTQFLSISHTHLHTIRIYFTHSPTNSLYSIRSTRSHAYNLYPFHTHTHLHTICTLSIPHIHIICLEFLAEVWVAYHYQGKHSCTPTNCTESFVGSLSE